MPSLRLVAGHPALDLPKAHALAALLLLQAARNPARVDPEGNLLLLSEQNRALGIAAAEEVRGHPALAGYYPLSVTLGELHARAGDEERAADCFREALAAESPEPVRRRIQARLLRLGTQ